MGIEWMHPGPAPLLSSPLFRVSFFSRREGRRNRSSAPAGIRSDPAATGRILGTPTALLKPCSLHHSSNLAEAAVLLQEQFLLIRWSQLSIFQLREALCFSTMSGTAGNTKFLLWLLLLSTTSLSSSCFGSELDIKCLKTVKQSVIDPNGILESSWNFNTTTKGFICQFTGVECWSPNDSRVHALNLSGLGLEGQFPRGLDLSNNKFSGPIPWNIAQQVAYLTSLDLSYNSFSGEIPVNICRDLNVLNIQHNQLSGQIPRDFGELLRLASLNVADNQLSGLIPSTLSKFPASSFSGNQGLCGPPLDDCGKTNDSSLVSYIVNDMIKDDFVVVGAAAGFVVGFVVAFYFPHVFVFTRRLHPYVYRIC
ncbi:hypothetical protein GQ55_5G061600 [Panicum hallii var. hallii]|uniref:Leucine-rich repeat-containing N-terminal plant-type domain-containing protein n=2 Tax=Panicum hallii var. hallii TaxID=1504633 RepID=A0A2T7DDC1_9POAL|nr:hypothetical protein GQ55_5G061600 [Panicum hallii var. hallii]